MAAAWQEYAIDFAQRGLARFRPGQHQLPAGPLQAREAGLARAARAGHGHAGSPRALAADPQNVLALDDLRIVTGYEIKPGISTKDDIAAVAQIKATPERHVMLYFGDHLN